MKKILCLILAVTLVISVWCCFSLFFQATQGNLYKIDGYTQSTHVYFEKLTVNGTSFSYTVVNRTRHTVVLENALPTLYLFDGQAWQRLDHAVISRHQLTDVNNTIRPLQKQQEKFSIKFLIENGELTSPPPGLYRLVLESEDFAVVGHITVTS